MQKHWESVQAAENARWDVLELNLIFWIHSDLAIWSICLLDFVKEHAGQKSKGQSKYPFEHPDAWWVLSYVEKHLIDGFLHDKNNVDKDLQENENCGHESQKLEQIVSKDGRISLILFM